MTKNSYIGIGLMSGTSLDGLDIVSVEFIVDEGNWNYRILNSRTEEYPETLLKKVRAAINHPFENHDGLDLSLGEWMGNCVNKFVSDFGIVANYVASHGQTIYHNPSEGLTIQLGSGEVMAEITKLKVINDFRTKDVQLGGQGAPLVPIGDLLLFGDYKYCLNLGGIANISIKNGGIKSFDVCICNAGLNTLSNKLGKPLDEGGKIGEGGKVLPDVLRAWNSLEYMSALPPKSLDASFFKNSMWSDKLFGKHTIEDCLRTIYEHIAFQIASVIEYKNEKILVTGGGTLNNFLIKLMKENYGLNLFLPERELIDYKEAMIFAFMGLLRMRNEINVLSSVTGSDSDHSSGIIHENKL